MSTSERKALIIGCGIAGPAVALFLRRAGIDAEIYEAQPAPDDNAGVFLTLASNGMEILEILGIKNRLVAEGIPTSRLVIWSSNAKRLGDVNIGAAGSRHTTSLTVKRGVIHRLLREEAVRQGISVEFGKRLTEIEVAGDRCITATFADGTAATGDLLIGCDGIHSRTRRWIDPAAPEPEYTGLIDVGGFARGTSLAPTPGTMHMIFGRRAFFGYIVGTSGDVYWFENHAYPGEPRRSTLETISQDEWKRTLLDVHAEDQPIIGEIIRSITGDIGTYPIYDIPTLPRWHRGPAVLIGDAAHATSPSAGQGASLALEDAIVLAKCLRDIPDVETASATYEDLRRERAENIVEYSRRRGNNKVLSNPVARWFRDLTMPFFLKYFANPTSLEWIYSYRVAWDEKVA